MARATAAGSDRLKYVTAVVLYGTVGLFLRYVSLPSELVALCRGVLGSAFILLYLAVRRIRPDRAAIRANLRWLVISGVCLGLNWVLLFAAYMKTTVAIASLCNYVAPMVVVLIAPLVLKEELDRRKLPCVAASLLGVLLISGVFGGEGGEPAGVLLGLGAAACFVGIVLCNRQLRGISSFDRSLVQLAVSAVTILPWVLIRNWGVPLHADTRSVWIVLMLGVVHTGVAYCLYFTGIGSLPVQTVAVLGYLEPAVSVLTSVFFLGEPLSLWGWLGAALIIASAVISELIPSKDT